MIAAQQQALDRLDGALQQAEPEVILAAARAIKPGFAKIYMSFGSFPQAP